MMILAVLVYVSLKHALIVAGCDFLTGIEKHALMCTHTSTSQLQFFCAMHSNWLGKLQHHPSSLGKSAPETTYCFYASIVM